MVTAKNLYFSYTGSPPYVLGGIDFHFKDGDYVSIVGDNGSGKSTLVKLVLRLIKPTGGAVSVSAGRIGYVPQKSDFASEGFPITVYEMLESYRKILKEKSKGEAEEKLELVGLKQHRSTLVGDLSGGQRQKVLIARALIGRPQLIILDEPSTGIDAESQSEIYGLLKKLNKESGITIVSVEHNLVAAISNSTAIYHLHGSYGHICTPEQYAHEHLNIGARKNTGD